MKQRAIPNQAQAEHLAAWRRRAGLTQNDLALRLGFSESRITKIETQRVAPASDVLNAIERVLTEAERQKVAF